MNVFLLLGVGASAIIAVSATPAPSTMATKAAPSPSQPKLTTKAPVAAPTSRARAATAIAQLAAVERLVALGAEPFWDLTIIGANAIYNDPAEQTKKRLTVTRSVEGEFLVLRGMMDGKKVIGRIRAAPCTDGMSEREFSFEISLKIGEESMQGCVRRADER